MYRYYYYIHLWHVTVEIPVAMLEEGSRGHERIGEERQKALCVCVCVCTYGQLAPLFSTLPHFHPMSLIFAFDVPHSHFHW